MPRVSKVDTCMICEQAPCVCFVKAKVVKPKREPKPKTEPVTVTETPPPSSAPRVSVRDRMRAAATAPPSRPTPPPPPPDAPPVTRLAPPKTKTIEEMARPPEYTDDEKVSIRILDKLNMLGASDRRKYGVFLSKDPTPSERATHWKRHHAPRD